MNTNNVEKLADDITLLLTKYGLESTSFDLTVRVVTDEHDNPVISELVREGNTFLADTYRITLDIQQ
jgi:hypothetical protein